MRLSPKSTPFDLNLGGFKGIVIIVEHEFRLEFFSNALVKTCGQKPIVIEMIVWDCKHEEMRILNFLITRLQIWELDLPTRHRNSISKLYAWVLTAKFWPEKQVPTAPLNTESGITPEYRISKEEEKVEKKEEKDERHMSSFYEYTHRFLGRRHQNWHSYLCSESWYSICGVLVGRNLLDGSWQTYRVIQADVFVFLLIELTE